MDVPWCPQWKKSALLEREYSSPESSRRLRYTSPRSDSDRVFLQSCLQPRGVIGWLPRVGGRLKKQPRALQADTSHFDRDDQGKKSPWPLQFRLPRETFAS